MTIHNPNYQLNDSVLGDANALDAVLGTADILACLSLDAKVNSPDEPTNAPVSETCKPSGTRREKKRRLSWLGL